MIWCGTWPSRVGVHIRFGRGLAQCVPSWARAPLIRIVRTAKGHLDSEAQILSQKPTKTRINIENWQNGALLCCENQIQEHIMLLWPSTQWIRKF